MPTYSGAIHMEYMPRYVVLKRKPLCVEYAARSCAGRWPGCVSGLPARLGCDVSGRFGRKRYSLERRSIPVSAGGGPALSKRAVVGVDARATLADTAAVRAAVWARAELKLEYRNHFADRIHVGVEGNYSRFRIRNPVAVHQLQKNEASQATEGQRVHLKPALSYELLRPPGYFLIPALQAHLA